MIAPSIAIDKPTNVRYGVLGFACILSMITYLDRVCLGTVMPEMQREFGLSEDQKGWIFFAFTLAYAAFEVPSGWLGDRFGARKTLIRIVLWWSVFTALTGSIYPTPGAATAFVLLLSVRFLFGLGEAGAYPNIARAFHSWFPFTERGSAKGAVWMAGRFAGGITAFIVYALMYQTVTPDGVVVHWRHTFYVFGALGVVWAVMWWWWYRDNPAEKAGVNAAELALIQGHSGHATHEKLVVPWGRLLRSGNLWTLCAMYACAAYGWYFFITYFPGYLKEQLHIEKGDVKWTAQFWTAGLMAGLPLMVGAVACMVGGFLSDQFIRRTGNRKWGRRLFGVVGHSLCASCYFLALLFMDRPWIFVILVTLGAFWNDMTMGAAWASCLDIGGRYSGIVAGCMNTIGNLGGGLANLFTGWILVWHTRGHVTGSPEFKAAQDQGWIVNIAIFGMAYVIATLCWLKFDPTKPVAPPEPMPPAPPLPPVPLAADPTLDEAITAHDPHSIRKNRDLEI